MKHLTEVMVVGLTGQTGAGKSTVSGIFADSGYAVINADYISRIVVEKGSECLNELADVFGAGILNPDGTLNRKALAGIVFTDKAKLEMLNSVIYPYITTEILAQIRRFSDNGNKLILLDAPTLFESHADDFCEIIISVTARPEVRKKRITERDGITAEQAQNRMDSQLDTDFFIEHSDYIIENNDSFDIVYGIAKELADKIKYYYYDVRSVIMTDF
ncbi:MAG: dephospho-CoA kinase [Ruminococcus flavefaciens]|nr:dephospho-CoA kinase [Ruminococcus flavefaciens]MCM1231650.1 dephospho-CoA kinase [Ruminococcus flavefaciens]